MKKRLRKKRRLGEFTELGFSLNFTMSCDLSVAERNSVLEEFISEIERLGLSFGGGGTDSWDGFVALTGRGSVTEEHRAVMLAWLQRHPNVDNQNVGELIDAWHGWD